MKPSLPLLLLSFSILSTGIAIPTPSDQDLEIPRGSVPDATVELGSDEFLLHGVTTRGSVPDATDLAVDIVDDDDEAAESLLTRSISALLRRETARAATDRLLFSTGISTFLLSKKARSPAGLVWDDDGCSGSPDKPAGFNFLSSCQRHDFGYRNYKAQGRFTAANRERIDENFKEDLYNMCKPYGVLKEAGCKVLANTYFDAVRLVGGL